MYQNFARAFLAGDHIEDDGEEESDDTESDNTEEIDSDSEAYITFTTFSAAMGLSP